MNTMVRTNNPSLDSSTGPIPTNDGQTYEELVNNTRRSSISNNNNIGGGGGMDESGYDLSIESDESITPNHNHKGRQSIGFMLGRNSLSNWTTIGGAQNDDDEEEEEEMEDIGHLNTGRKSNVTGRKQSSMMETPLMGQMINVSSRRSTHQYSSSARVAGTSSSRGRARDRESNNNHNNASSLGRRRSTNPLNISHISSSSSSNGGFDDSMMMQDMSMMRDSWSPIRGGSLEHSFEGGDASRRAMRSLSPRRRSSRGRSRSPTSSSAGSKRGLFSRGRSASPPRSPLGDISPNRHQVVRSQEKKSSSPLKSPNGTFSLKEASPSVSSVQQQQQQQDLTSPNQKKNTIKTVVGGGRKSISLPSLASTRKSFGFSPAVVKGTPPNVVAKEASDTTNNSSQSSNNGGVGASEIKTVRSPIPTPNSQRRLVKRFRASVPTANYMEPEDLEKEEDAVVVKIGNSGSDTGTAVGLLRRFEKSTSSTLGKTQTQQQMEPYKNEFVFPESIPVPSRETLLAAHNKAISAGAPSHQYQLTRAGTNLLSLQEVILPSILAETSSALKQKQSKAQRYVKDGMPDHQGKDVVEVIEACRKLVNRCIGEAMKDAGDSWRKREEGRAKARMERHLAQVEQRKTTEMQAKRQRKEQRAHARQERYEVAKKKMMQCHPRNKAIFSELVDLDRELPKLKREERKWLQVKKELESLGDPNNPVMKLDPVVVPSSSSAAAAAMGEQVENTPLEHTATTMVEDVTMAMNRLNWMLTSISSAMEESDKLRTEAFTKYNTDHKMIGFTEYDDPKDLFRRVARKSIGGTPARA